MQKGKVKRKLKLQTGGNIMKGLDLAKYVVNYACLKDTPISNLQLQKILYFINGNYYRRNGKFLVDSDFMAYPFGPVIPAVYQEFKHWGSSDIIDSYDIAIDNDEDNIKKDIDHYSKISVYDLVQMSHEPSGAWFATKNSVGLFNKIKKEDMIKEFSNA